MKRFLSFVVLDPVVLLLISLISLFLVTGDTTNGVLYAFVFFGPIIAFSFQQRLWRYASIDDVWDFAKVISPFVMSIPVLWFLDFLEPTYLIIGGLSVGYLFLSRFGLRLFAARPLLDKTSPRLLIYGAGGGGDLVYKELSFKKQIVAFVDDDISKRNSRLHGKIIYHSEELSKLILEEKINEVVIAIPSLSKLKLFEIIRRITSFNVSTSVLTSLEEVHGDDSKLQTRPVKIEDVLGREVVVLENENLTSHLSDKTILVTGAGGSIGSELCRQLIQQPIKKLILLDQYENSLFEIEQELLSLNPSIAYKIIALIASVQDKKRIMDIMSEHHIQIVFHAAAHKHVPLMQSSPKEAIKNNVIGTLNLIQACETSAVNQVVVVSTDKAVRPTSYMGASKRMVELLMQSFSKSSKIKYTAVRFGNVLGSNGSVIPIFEKQISRGGPITVTHPDMVRYFMTIKEACQLILESAVEGESGDIFVLDMGQPVKISDLAEKMILLSGYQPHIDIKIEFTGVRPGEKMYEELTLDADAFSQVKSKKLWIEKHKQDFDLDLDKLADEDYSMSILERLIQQKEFDS